MRVNFRRLRFALDVFFGNSSIENEGRYIYKEIHMKQETVNRLCSNPLTSGSCGRETGWTDRTDVNKELSGRRQSLHFDLVRTLLRVLPLVLLMGIFSFSLRAEAAESRTVSTEDGEWIWEYWYPQGEETDGDIYSFGRCRNAASGEYLSGGWHIVDGCWYYFTDNGYAKDQYHGGYALGEFYNGGGTYASGTSPRRYNWHQDVIGWWYGKSGGNYLKNCRVWIDGKLYLDFLIKDSASVTDLRLSPEGQSEKSNSDGFYRAASSASGIMISQPLFDKEVLSYFVSNNGKDIYRIRYWLSEMEYSYEKASFSDADKVFTVDKYLRIGSNVYQCTTGRSTKIRNIQKSSEFEKTTLYDKDGGIIALGEPYLIKVPDVKDRNDLLDSVEENNKKKKPAPKPLFPPTFPKYRWKEISELELYNPSTWNKRNLDIHK